MNIELSVIDLLLKDIENEQFFFFFVNSIVTRKWEI